MQKVLLAKGCRKRCGGNVFIVEDSDSHQVDSSHVEF